MEIDVKIIDLKFKSLKTCFKMFEARKYNIDPDAKKFIETLNINDYEKLVLYCNKKDKNDLPYEKKVFTPDEIPYVVQIDFCNEEIGDKRHDVLKAYFGLSSSNNDDKIIELKKDIEKTKIHHIMIFTSNGVTSERIDKFYELNIPHMEYFGIKQMSIDIINHIFQPKFEIYEKPVNEQELKMYKDICKNNSKFCINDPIVRYFNASVDTLFKITRHSGSLISTTYRVVKNIKMNEVKSKISKNYTELDSSGGMEDE